MEQRVQELLWALGYEMISDADRTLINVLIAGVSQEIKNYCNQKDVPAELEESVAENACGLFLQKKKCSGEVLGIDLTSASVKQLDIGDTSTVYALGDGSSTPEQRLDIIISYLTNHGRKLWKNFRRLKW